jgi:hypothetical protein
MWLRVKVKVMFTLKQVMKAQRGSTFSLTLELDGGGWSSPHLGYFTPGRDPVPIV